MIYLGFDLSTQSLTATLIEIDGARRSLVCEESFTYGDELPQYGTDHGVVRGACGVVTSPPVMWIDAIDRMMARLVHAWPREMAHLAAVSGAAQQHGSVYLHARGVGRFAAVDPATPIGGQWADAFTRDQSPVWMDSSTAVECGEIAALVGGQGSMARLTGSQAFERFTGPQIRRFFKTEAAAYAATARIHLVSSFAASLLAGLDAPVDRADASGMNLMDLAPGAWWPAALAATAPDLAAKLPAIVPSDTVIGSLGRYWRDRYRLPPALVVAWTGDNPSSLVGCGAVEAGTIVISLGTSDTIFGTMREPRVSASGEGHVFGSPTGQFMGLTCFQNGSLARERVRDRYGLTWGQFSAALRSTPVGNAGAMMLPWLDSEITPQAPAGVHRRTLTDDVAAANVRAVVEAQMMAMANHVEWMGAAVTSILATGGAAANAEILQVMAGVFDATVRQLRVGNSASLGAALRACHADPRARGGAADWREVIAGFTDPMTERAIVPDEADAAIYRTKRRDYAEFERAVVDCQRARDLRV